MMTDYEPVVAALWDHLKKNVSGISYASRRIRMWSDCPNQPAMFLRHIGEDIDWQDARLARTTLHLEIWLYSKAGRNPELAPDVELDALVKAVLDAFTPDNPMTRTFTLGGLLGLSGWARVEGKIDHYPGDLAEQAIAVVPVTILLA